MVYMLLFVCLFVLTAIATIISLLDDKDRHGNGNPVAFVARLLSEFSGGHGSIIKCCLLQNFLPVLQSRDLVELQG